MKRWLTHWFLPHKSNRHHARLLHADVLISFLAIFLMGHVFLSVQYGLPLLPRLSGVLGQETSITQKSILDATNAERIAAGKTALQWNDSLARAAQSKAQDMLQGNYWSHNTPDGRTPWSFIDNTDYEYSVAGENLARNFTSSPMVIRAWMNSPTHRANILHEDYADIGIAVVQGQMEGQDTILVVQLFGTPKTHGSLLALPEGLLNGAQNQAIADQQTDRTVRDGNQNQFAAGLVTPPEIHVLGTQIHVNAISLYRLGSLSLLGMVLAVVLHDEWLVRTGKLGKRRRKSQNWAHLAILVVVVLTFALAETV